MNTPIIIPTSQVLDLIDPVDPDNLRHVGAGIYEALWCPPVLEMDIEVLKRTPRVEIKGEVFEPELLPGWAAIRFTIQEDR